MSFYKVQTYNGPFVLVSELCLSVRVTIWVLDVVADWVVRTDIRLARWSRGHGRPDPDTLWSK